MERFIRKVHYQINGFDSQRDRRCRGAQNEYGCLNICPLRGKGGQKAQQLIFFIFFGI